MTVPIDELPVAEFAFPGPLRDALVAAVLSGAKTTTTGLLAGYQHADEPVPVAGQRNAVIDSAGARVAVIETIEVRIVPICDIDEEFARAEGEGYTTVAQWRVAHEGFWHSEEMVAFLGRRPVIDDDTLVVAERFRLISSDG